MNFLPTDSIFNIITLVILFLILLSFISLIVAVYNFLSRWLEFLQEDKIVGAEKIKQDAYRRSQEILDKAREESVQMVSEAMKDANELFDSMESVSDESKEKLRASLSSTIENQKKALNKTSDELLCIYKTEIEGHKMESLKTLADLSEVVSENLSKEFEEFEELLRGQTVGVEDEIRSKIVKKYEKIDSELTNYRDKKLEKLDESINGILYDISEKVLGEGLSMGSHQELILESLEEAKNSGLFDH